MDNLYDYVFHYSPYTELWNAIPRDIYNDYWSHNEFIGVLRAKDINVIIDLVQKGPKFIEEIE